MASRLGEGVSEVESRSSSRIGDTGRRVVKDEMVSRSIRGVRVTASETGYPWSKAGYACAASNPTCFLPAQMTPQIPEMGTKAVRGQGYHRRQ